MSNDDEKLIKDADVAEMLGYASIGAFTRWHAQTVGLSPLQWRAENVGKRSRKPAASSSAYRATVCARTRTSRPSRICPSSCCPMTMKRCAPSSQSSR